MSKLEISAERPTLEADVEPTPVEKQILDEALAAFEHDGNFGEPWRDVLRRVLT